MTPHDFINNINNYDLNNIIEQNKLSEDFLKFKVKDFDKNQQKQIIDILTQCEDDIVVDIFLNILDKQYTLSENTQEIKKAEIFLSDPNLIYYKNLILNSINNEDKKERKEIEREEREELKKSRREKLQKAKTKDVVNNILNGISETELAELLKDVKVFTLSKENWINHIQIDLNYYNNDRKKLKILIKTYEKENKIEEVKDLTLKNEFFKEEFAQDHFYYVNDIKYDISSRYDIIKNILFEPYFYCKLRNILLYKK
jgi:hypothetical protein